LLGSSDFGPLPPLDAVRQLGIRPTPEGHRRMPVQPLLLELAPQMKDKMERRPKRSRLCSGSKCGVGQSAPLVMSAASNSDRACQDTRALIWIWLVRSTSNRRAAINSAAIEVRL
jgi:hypothetical protein